VKELVKKTYGLSVSDAYVASVLRNVLGMRYKRVKRVAMQANSEASLVKRKVAAEVLLDAMQQGKRILNIDETWLGETDFRRLKWRGRGESNSLSTKDVSPRLSMLAAIDNFGGLYVSILQDNVDHGVFEVFLTKLVAKLTTEDANWR
jgi:hypothetical protein